MSAPEVTVLMPAYNAEKYLADAMESILKQRFRNFELIVVNDASTDRTQEIIESYKDERIRPFRNTRNLRAAEARNMGLCHARAPLAALMDADDLADPHRLEEQVKFMRSNPTVSLAATWGNIIDDHGALLRSVTPSSNPSLLRWRLLLFNQLIHSTVMVRTNVLRELGGYRTSAVPSEDYDLYCRLMRMHEFGMIPKTLVSWRTHVEGVSATKRSIQEKVADEIATENAVYLLRRNVPVENIRGLKKVLSLRERGPKDNIEGSAGLLREVFSAFLQHWPPGKRDRPLVERDYVEKMAILAGLYARTSRKKALAVLADTVRCCPSRMIQRRVFKSLIKTFLGPAGIAWF